MDGGRFRDPDSKDLQGATPMTSYSATDPKNPSNAPRFPTRTEADDYARAHPGTQVATDDREATATFLDGVIVWNPGAREVTGHPEEGVARERARKDSQDARQGKGPTAPTPPPQPQPRRNPGV